jgi:hypothetical protein
MQRAVLETPELSGAQAAERLPPGPTDHGVAWAPSSGGPAPAKPARNVTNWLTSPQVSVVVPTLNEAANLPHVLPRIPPWVHEVILVDGRSTDATVDVARRLWPSIRVVQQRGKGKGDALRSGFAAATGDIIVMIDADGSTDPGEIPAFVGALLAGADFAKGSRFLQGGGTSDMELHRKMGNWGLLMLVRQLFGGQYTDLCYGYNAFWTTTIRALHLDGDGFEIETMMNVRALRTGLKIAEVPSFEAARVYGSSRLRAIPDGLRVLGTIVREWQAARVARRGTQARRRVALAREAGL